MARIWGYVKIRSSEGQIIGGRDPSVCLVTSCNGRAPSLISASGYPIATRAPTPLRDDRHYVHDPAFKPQPPLRLCSFPCSVLPPLALCSAPSSVPTEQNTSLGNVWACQPSTKTLKANCLMSNMKDPWSRYGCRESSNEDIGL